jgi:hypothetical protein
MPEYEAPVDGGADNGSTGVTAGSPTSSTEQGSTTGAPPQSGASSAGAAPPVQPPRDGTWIPRERLNEQQMRYEAQLRQMQSELERARTPQQRPAPTNAEHDAIRQRLFEIAPQLKDLLDLDAKELKDMLSQRPQVEAHTQHYWTVVGAGALRQIRGGLEKLYGGKPDQFVQEGVETHFANWLKSDPEAFQRYIQQDPDLVPAFLKRYETQALDPIRRQALVSEQQRAQRRANLPPSGPRTSQLGAGQKKEKPKTEDELHEQAWEALTQQR